MRKIVCSLVILINSVYLFAQWKPVGGRIMTEWAAKIDVENVLPEYPRPIMERADWINLNGLWNYAISPVGQAMPQSYGGRILVPFAVQFLCKYFYVSQSFVYFFESSCIVYFL